MNLRQKIDSVPYWYHQIELAPGVVTPGPRDSKALLERLKLPQDMRGMRVLDIGARDGFFSFACERRGAAEVIPVDYVAADRTGFPVAREALGSKLNMVHENIYNLTPEKYGQFDIVLMLGLLYHLPDPMRALDIVFNLLKRAGQLYLESIIIDGKLPTHIADRPFMLFYPKDTKGADQTNYWGMTQACASALLEENNFRVLFTSREGERGIFAAVKAVDARDYYSQISHGLVK